MQRYHRESNTEKHAHLRPHERPGAFAQPGIGIRRLPFEDDSESQCEAEAVVGLDDVEVVDEQQEQERERKIEERRQTNREKEQRVREMELRLQQIEQRPAVEATPIQQDVDANESDNASQAVCCCKNRRCVVVSVALLLVVIAVIAVGIGLAVTSDKSESNASQEIVSDAITTDPPVLVTEPPTIPPLSPTNEPWTNYWKQLGRNLPGEGSDDRFGSSVALSANGTIVAAGARLNDGNGYFSGHVRVFEFDESNNRWNQLGQDIDGEAADDYFGTSVALSADGTIVAAGADYNDGNGSASGRVRVFEFDESSNIWIQLGQDIDGEAEDDSYGTSVALSADGRILAAGAKYNDGNGTNSGHVRVFDFDESNNQWNQLGQDIDGEASFDLFGTSVALSANGTIAAAGAYGNDGNGEDAGHVRVLKFDDSNNQWKQLGHDIDGEAEDDRFGTSVALSANGTIVAAGAKYNDGNGSSSGHVRVFEFDESNNQWNQLGQDIDGDAIDDEFGLSVALSADGTIVGSGAAGYARVLQYNNETNQWIQLGNDTVKQGTFDCTVALSADGSIAAVGLGTDRGIVRIFRSES